ncbi:uncharacterized protein LOC125216992 isoform X3 [Salvia hispanica]|uniref:uncharacterized protein LOC125216992 isoform X2 n=1 Tax=Salvia hispanica TaxID=49212 RepID=UPI002009366F|nr:uncharacterized protein LOC125216992 isoform X2 [Salvia hispanica]XP_047974758.1 uncharacterized protein LOC125216992 isoform X3 [Salvia hispanica]XP_047974759.1 uncharacterized protein LOC125216992 isoform X3 [Salvia hispanica]XP_047974760.1 uncharacterized protein LOC125216992 isoform X3 [Salvia hispanica]
MIDRSSPACCREDLASLLRSVQVQEIEKLNLAISDTCSVSLNIMCSFFSLTATIQVLKKAGRPSERLVSHENCRYAGHKCMHIQQITEESGTEEAEADSEYDNALKEAVKGMQDAVISINEYLEEVRKDCSTGKGIHSFFWWCKCKGDPIHKRILRINDILLFKPY